MKNSHLIPTDRIIERLRYENPWWLSGHVSEIYRNMAKRLYLICFSLSKRRYKKGFGIDGFKAGWKNCNAISLH